ncbi:MAG TPA: methyltransferase domain-containing protein [Myxococcota bacterium]|nr:methyltransferase domain-containing protein [Myxococcota bacterium]
MPASELIDVVARRFAGAGTMARSYARAKLVLDPIYFSLLRHGLIPDGMRLLDLGCGQGILLALLVAAREAARAGEWPSDWAPPPALSELRGIELDAAEVRRARIALRGAATVEERDLCEAKLPASDVIALVDVIHYLRPAEQERLLSRAAEALDSGGVLLMRVCDAADVLRAFVTRASDRFGSLTKRGSFVRIHSRSAAEWIGRLEQLGFSVDCLPMSAGTPFANVLLSARKR